MKHKGNQFSLSKVKTIAKTVKKLFFLKKSEKMAFFTKKKVNLAFLFGECGFNPPPFFSFFDADFYD